MPKVAGSTVGDFAETVYWVIKSRFEEDGSMTIYDVNQLLDEIAMIHTTNKSSNLYSMINTLIFRFTTVKYFIASLLIRKS